MTDKELRKLKRADLLELLIDQDKQMEALKAKLAEAESSLAERSIMIEKAGSIAEASVALNGVFAAAQSAAVQYLENIKEQKKQQEEKCAQMEEESRRQAEELMKETMERCRKLEEETRKRCKRMLDEVQETVKKEQDCPVAQGARFYRPEIELGPVMRAGLAELV
jgi:hypothetical protein